MKKLRGRLGLKGFCGVDSSGMSGGLAMYWHENYVVDVLDKDDRHVDALVRVKKVRSSGELRSCMVNRGWRIGILCGQSYKI